MRKKFRGFGPHVKILVLFTAIAVVALVLVSILSPTNIGALLYALGGLALFYVLLRRHGGDQSREIVESGAFEEPRKNDTSLVEVKRRVRERKAYRREMNDGGRTENDSCK